MGKKILFSPVGGTDPIRYLRDGSMLHICRHYQPDVVYLYLSQEMVEHHRNDDRYRYTLNRLGEFLHHTFEIHVIEREDLVDVQRYDLFYEDFTQEIRKIEEGMRAEDELLLNMASGTPGMKSALLVIATLAEYKYTTVQVDTPQGRINSEYEDRDHYDSEVNWELDEDNAADAPNRCVEIQCRNLLRMLKLDIIKKHIRAYDYPAALAVAEEISSDIPADAYTLLQIADARVKLVQGRIGRINAGKHYVIYPVQDGQFLKIFEYALVLGLKLKKQEYADFVRGITPLVVDLLEMILKKQCGIRLEDYCSFKKGVLCWNVQKMETDEVGKEIRQLLEGAYPGFKPGPVYSSALAIIIQKKSGKSELKKRIGNMLEVEKSVRNVAAHEIISVTEEWIKEKTNMTSEQIFQMIIYLMKEAGARVTDEALRSYDDMNAQIEEYLN